MEKQSFICHSCYVTITFCKRGHIQTPENVRPNGKGCRVCHRQLERERKRAAKGHWPKGTRPDRRGHLPGQFPRNNGKGCAECHRLDESERYQADKATYQAKARTYQQTHRAEAKARHEAWRDANVEHVRAYSLKMMRARKVGRTAEGIEFVDILRHDPCSYCGGPAGHIDHIEPLAFGGENSWENLAAACKSCNSKKKTKSLLMFLLSVA